LLLFFAYGLADWCFKLDNSKYLAKKTLFVITGSIILISYTLKLWSLYDAHKVAV